MILLTIIIFALASLIGLYLLSFVLTNKNTPKGVVMIHGGIAALGIALLIVYSLLYQSPLASLLIFLGAAGGGVTLFYWDITGKKIPKIFVVGHGLLALCGFILLVIFAFKIAS